jgi:hypothetical protein
MRKILLASVILLIPALAGADRLVRIPAATDSDFSEIQALGYEITSGSREQGYVDVLVSERFVDEALRRHPEARLLPLEWSQPLPGDDRNEFGYYYGPNENAAFWATLAQNSDLVDTPAVFGQSWQGRDLYYVRITNASPSAPAILFTALQHGREPGGNSVVIDWGQWLATEYGSDTMATFILDNAQIYIVPISNIDGYYYNLPSGGPNQRKNMNFSDPVASSGVDLNRNWSYMWGYDNTGSSPDPYAATYRGSAPLSEPENIHLAALMQDIDPLGGFHYHTYGGYLLYPWGYNNQATPDQTTFQSWGAQMTSQNNYQYGRAGQILYMVNGEANDWAYGELNSLFFCPEVDDNGFWGSQNDTSLIVTNNLECRYMNKLLCMNLLAMVDIEVENHAETGQGAAGITVHGNPVESLLAYTVTGTPNQGVTILDVAGRTVGSAETGVWQVPSHLTNGVYFLQAQGSS